MRKRDLRYAVGCSIPLHTHLSWLSKQQGSLLSMDRISCTVARAVRLHLPLVAANNHTTAKQHSHSVFISITTSHRIPTDNVRLGHRACTLCGAHWECLDKRQVVDLTTTSEGIDTLFCSRMRHVSSCSERAIVSYPGRTEVL